MHKMMISSEPFCYELSDYRSVGKTMAGEIARLAKRSAAMFAFERLLPCVNPLK